MSRLFASDFDGTIYFRENEEKIDPRFVETVENFQKQGHLFGYCSGRPALKIEAPEVTLPHPDFIISTSGSLILDKEKRVIFEKTIPYHVISDLFEYAVERHLYPKVHSEGNIYIKDALPYFTIGFEKIENVDLLKEKRIHGISFEVKTFEEAQKITAFVNETYGNDVIAYQNMDNIDITAKGCSKGNGIKFVKQYFSVSQTYGIGDSLNDIPLMEGADVGFTFPWTDIELQKKADHIVDSVVDAIKIAEKMD